MAHEMQFKIGPKVIPNTLAILCIILAGILLEYHLYYIAATSFALSAFLIFGVEFEIEYNNNKK